MSGPASGPSGGSAGLPTRGGAASAGRHRVLFVAEAITLAQVVRLVTLARTLDPREYEVHFACAAFPERIFRPGELVHHPLRTVAADKALARLQRGGRLYDLATLEGYLSAEQALIAAVRPALIVGDLRWSLAVSAPLAGVPYAALANAYMSPFARRERFPLPDHPIVSLLGERLAAEYFPRALPRVFDWFARPLNQLRRRHGLPAVGSLLEVLTFGDLTLYADAPGWVVMDELPAHHRFLGPVGWSPSDAVPAGWGTDPHRTPIYLTLGSSGDVRLLPRVLAGLRELPVDVLVATADRSPGVTAAGAGPSGGGAESGASRTWSVPFVSGSRAAASARLVISNGGSTTGYQALAAGCPVLGLPHNLEQHLAMVAVTESGAGRSLPARQVSAARVRGVVEEMLRQPAYARAAGRAAEQFATINPQVVFPRLVQELFAPGGRCHQGA